MLSGIVARRRIWRREAIGIWLHRLRRLSHIGPRWVGISGMLRVLMHMSVGGLVVHD